MNYKRLSSQNHSIDISFQAIKTVYSSDSNPKIEVLKIKDNGLCLTMEEDIQFLESQHETYHEPFTHTPCRYVQKIEDVLILGGGDGGVATEILKYPSVKNVTVVDLSKDVVDLCLKYFPKISSGLLDTRTEIIHDNACSWIKKQEKQYDLIYIDTTDFNFKHENDNTILDPSCAESKKINLRDSNNIFNCLKNLNKGGVLTFNHDFCGLDAHSVYVKENFLRQKFADTIPFTSNIPYFPGNQYCFIMCSSEKFKKFNELDFSISGINTRIYNRNSHLASLFISKEYEDFFPGLQMDIEKC